MTYEWIDDPVRRQEYIVAAQEIMDAKTHICRRKCPLEASCMCRESLRAYLAGRTS